MRDLFLKFKDGDEMSQQLKAIGFIPDEYGTLTHPDINLDIIGTISILSEVIGEGTDNQTEKYIKKEGYHANLRVIDDDIDLTSLEEYLVYPENPVRVWA